MNNQIKSKNLPIIFFIAAVLFFGVSSCNGPKEVVAEMPARHFVIGQGGGFTGKYDIYKVHNDGKIEKKDDRGDSYTYLKNMPIDSATVCFTTLDKLALENIKFEYPDNMTYFIEVNNGTEINRIKWGNMSHPIRKDIESFYRRVSKMIKSDYPDLL